MHNASIKKEEMKATTTGIRDFVVCQLFAVRLPMAKKMAKNLCHLQANGKEVPPDASTVQRGGYLFFAGKKHRCPHLLYLYTLSLRPCPTAERLPTPPPSAPRRCATSPPPAGARRNLTGPQEPRRLALSPASRRAPPPPHKLVAPSRKPRRWSPRPRDSSPPWERSIELLCTPPASPRRRRRPTLPRARIQPWEVRPLRIRPPPRWTFYLGTLLMTEERRRAIWAIYVWCRRTDELVDGPNASHITPQALDRWERRLEDLFTGHPYDMLDAALSDTIAMFPIDIQVGLESLNLVICPKLSVLLIEAPNMSILELKGCGVFSEASINCPCLISLDASFCRQLMDDLWTCHYYWR
ncbi:uncharacterized protein [Triticum aestivum]|uniref:uncharacterized protein n=1 Tax=Triticum aestivum TaxID=4565 RepID=UPI001D03378E|nr:uncharacterized protein LOC123139251 [Triticum aestivum]